MFDELHSHCGGCFTFPLLADYLEIWPDSKQVKEPDTGSIHIHLRESNSEAPLTEKNRHCSCAERGGKYHHAHA